MARNREGYTISTFLVIGESVDIKESKHDNARDARKENQSGEVSGVAPVHLMLANRCPLSFFGINSCLLYILTAFKDVGHTI